MDVYFGINPRVGGAGKKENVHWLIAFHTEVDYGQEGHKKKSEYDTREEAFEAITRFELRPTIVNHSGGGFHCYWILIEPVKVSEFGHNSLENVNRNLLKMLHADTGTHEISRILRVPGTFNLKLPENPTRGDSRF